MEYKYDLHVHTKEISPCGSLGLIEIIDHYIENGYQGLVLTDHLRKGYFRKLTQKNWKRRTTEFLESYDRALEYCKDKDFFIGLGMEITLVENSNEYLVFGFNREDILENEWMIDLTLEEFFNKFKEKAVIIQAHPHRQRGSKLADINYLHGLEIRNGNERHNNQSELTQEIFNNNPHLIGIGGSDVHEKEDLCVTGIATNTKINSDKELVKILRNKEFKVL